MRNWICVAAAMTMAPAAQAAQLLSSSFSGTISAGVPAQSLASTANPAALDLAVSSAQEAELSASHLEAQTSFAAGGRFGFEHEGFGYGQSAGSGITRIRDEFTNTGAAARFELRTQILPGRIALTQALLDSGLGLLPSGQPLAGSALMAEFTFDILVDNLSLYTATARLETAAGQPTLDQLGGRADRFTGLVRSETIDSLAYDWAATDLVFNLGTIAAGQMRVIEILLTTTHRTVSTCSIGAVGCGVAQVAFGDPGGGGVVIPPFALGFSSLRIAAAVAPPLPPPPNSVPAPAALLLLGLGLGALLVRRR